MQTPKNRKDFRRKVLAAAVSSTLVFTGAQAVVTSPTAHAQLAGANNYFEPVAVAPDFNEEDPGILMSANTQLYETTDYGWGWCMDVYARSAGGDGYTPRKLSTYMDYPAGGGAITEKPLEGHMRDAAINVVKHLVRAYHDNDVNAVKKYQQALQALQSGQTGGMGEIRMPIKMSDPGYISHAEFMELTGYQITSGAFQPLVRVPEITIPQAQDHEYITVLVYDGWQYNTDVKSSETKQRLIPIDQPGLDIFEPEPTPEPTPPVSEGGESTPAPTPEPTPNETETLTETETQTEIKTIEHNTETIIREYYYYFYYSESRRSATYNINISGDWKYEVTQGGNLVIVEKDSNGNLVVTPNPGSNGTVVVVITDQNGNQYEYNIEVGQQESPSTTIINNYYYEINQGGSQTVIVNQGSTYQVTQGGELVIVEKDANGNLVVTPKPGQSGGNVTIVVTNPDGSTSTHTIVIEQITNIDYTQTVQQGGSITITQRGNYEVTKGGDLVIVEKDSSGNIVVTPKPGAPGGEVVIVVTDQNGNTHTYTITVVERPTQTFTQNITIIQGSNTTINYKGEYTVTEGGDKVTITRDNNGYLVITPKDGATGKVVIEITDEFGNKHVFNITIQAPVPVVQTYNVTILNSQETTITMQQGYTYNVTQGNVYVTITRDANGNLVVTPKDGQSGNVTIEIRDANGNLVATYNITILMDQTSTISTNEHTLSITDTQQITVRKGESTDTIRITKGGDLVTHTTDANGNWIIKPKPEANGIVVVEVVNSNGHVTNRWTINISPEPAQEFVRNILDTQVARITIDSNHTYSVVSGSNLVNVSRENGQLVVTPVRGSQGQSVIEVKDASGKVIFRYILNITPDQTPVREITQNITDQHTANITVGTTDSFEITKGGDLITVRREGNNLIVTPQQGANGQAVIEVKNSNGVVTTRYILNITPVAPQTNEIVQNISDTTELTVTVGSNVTHTVTKGSDLINVTREGNVLIIKPVKGANGQAVIELKDANGNVIVRYIVNITPTTSGDNGGSQTPTVKIIERNVTDNANITVSIESNHSYTVVEGGNLVNITREGGNLVIKPVTGANGKTVIEVKDANGNTIFRYILNITKTVETPQQPTVEVETIPSGGTGQITIGQQGNTLEVVSGSELAVITKESNGGLTIDPKPGVQGEIVVHEKDSNGNTIRIITVKVNELDEFEEPGGTITIDDVDWVRNPDGTITVTVPEGGGKIIVIGGNATVKPGSKPGEFIITPNDGNTDPIEFGFEHQPGDTIRVNVTNNFGSSGGGSSAQGVGEGSSSPTCIATGLLTALPLLALIPVGLATQVNIPGMEGLRAQVDAAIRDANTQFQQGFGIFNNDLASQMNAALGFDIRPVVSISAAGLGLAAAGIILSEVLLRACGMEDMTLSGQLSSASDGADGSSFGSSDPAVKD